MQRFRGAYVSVAVLAVIYAALAIGLPPDPATLLKYNITSLHLRILSLTIVIPVTLIWFAAIYGYVRSKMYAETVKETKEGKPIQELVKGIGILAYGLPISAIASTLLRYAGRQTDVLPLVTILINYLNIFISLAGFLFIYQGAKGLRQLVKVDRGNVERVLFIIGFIGLAISYTWITLANPARTVATEGVARAVYYLPDGLIVATIIIPYLYIWFIGMNAALYIGYYQRSVKGVLYRSALRFLALGIAAVIIASILMQYLTAMTVTLNRLNLTPLLVLVYALLVVISIGYMFIAAGSKRLQKIEEV